MFKLVCGIKSALAWLRGSFGLALGELWLGLGGVLAWSKLFISNTWIMFSRTSSRESKRLEAVRWHEKPSDDDTLQASPSQELFSSGYVPSKQSICSGSDVRNKVHALSDQTGMWYKKCFGLASGELWLSFGGALAWFGGSLGLEQVIYFEHLNHVFQNMFQGVETP